jgi:hypothetical protein
MKSEELNLSGEGMDIFDLIPRDTTLEAYAFLVQVWRRMGPEGRLRAAFEASNNLRDLAATGVRMRHPAYSEVQVQRAVTKLMIGTDNFHKVLPGVEIET